MASFAFQIPAGDSADLVLALSAAPDLTGWALTFTAGTLTKTSAGGGVVASTGGATVHVAAGDLPTAGTITATLVATLGADQMTWYGSIIVLSAAPTGHLTTLAAVRAYLRITSPAETTWDAELTRLIGAISEDVRRQTDRTLYVPAAAVSERHHGDGSNRLLLGEYPVVGVARVFVDGTLIPMQTTDGGSGWFLDGDVVELSGYAFTRGRGNVRVDYVAGWSTVPADLEQAVIQLVALAFTDEDHVGLASKTVNGDVATWNGGAQLANSNRILERYSRISVA